MPTLIKKTGDRFVLVEDTFSTVEAEGDVPAGDVILPLARFLAEGDALIGEGRKVGVWVAPADAVEDLAYDLPRIAVVALEFPKFTDGRAFSSATLLRQRFGYAGEVRAVGAVLREQADFMVRCGFDAFAAIDGSSSQEWEAATKRHRHVYQRAADGRAPAFEERQ